MIKLLIVDDSAIYRKVISEAVENNSNIELVAVAKDAYEAKDKIIEFRPDVIVLDIEMPRISGLEFLKILMPQHPMRVIVASTLGDKVFDALNAGALDFIEKPSLAQKNRVASFAKEIEEKIVTVAGANLNRDFAMSAKKNMAERNTPKPEHVKPCGIRGIIAIGASTGGTEASSLLLKKLPANIPGIVMTQHMPPEFTKLYARRLDKECALSVKEAQTGDVVLPGWVYIAPGDQHLTVKQVDDKMIINVRGGSKVNNHCPSVDVMFSSVSKLNCAKIGVILTGMGNDGARGLLEMRAHGAYTIAQDEETCVVYGMPKEAKKFGAVMKQAPIQNISDLILSQLNKLRQGV